MSVRPNTAISSRDRIQTVLRGEEPDRLPVWIKTPPQWPAHRPRTLRGASYLEIQRALGCDPVLMTGSRVVAAHQPGVTREVFERGDERITRVSTPDGPLVGKEGGVRDGRLHPTRHMVHSAETLRRLRWLYTKTDHTLDPEAKDESRYWRASREAEDVFLCLGHVTSPLMMMVEFLAGPVNTVFLLQDEPELFRETMEILREDRIHYLRSILPHVHTDMFKLAEDTSTNVISPSMFGEFCVPVLREYAEVVMEHGMIPVHHMCGLIGDLLEMIDGLPAPVNEAFTTRPLGDVSLAEGRTRMPSKVLLGGTNATLWLRPPEEIVDTVRQDLERCPDHRKIFLTSGGALPPDVPFEKASEVVAAFQQL